MKPAASKPAALALSSVELKLDLVEVPRPSYNRAQKWVLLGRDHGFMPRLLELIRKSPTASALLNRKTALVTGDGLKINAQALPALATFAQKVAASGRHRTADALFKRLVKDFVKLRGFAVQVVWAKDGLHLAELHFQRFETVASGPMNDEGEVEQYFICRDWKKRGQYPPKPIPAFNPALALSQPVQLFYHYEEQPGVEYYPALDYEAALVYIEMESDLGRFHGGNVATNFAANTIISINKGPEDDVNEVTGDIITAKVQRGQFEREFEAKYMGPAGKRMLFLWGDGTTDAAEKLAKLQSFGQAGTGEFYSSLAALAQQAILSACSCTSPVVAGLPGEGGLGGNASELHEAFELFYNAVCRPDQLVIREALRELFTYVAGVDFAAEPSDTPWLDITTTLPVGFTFSEQTMELIMTDDELRAKIGLKPLPAGASTAAEPPALPPAGPPTAHPPTAPAA